MFTAYVGTLDSDSELDRTIIEDSGYEAKGCGSVLIPRIVSRVHVRESERPDPVHLNDRRPLGPCEVVHAMRHRYEPSWLHQLTLGRIKFVPHACAESAAQYRYVLIGRMPVRRDL